MAKTNITVEQRNSILEELTKIVESGDILGTSQRELASRFNTRRQTIKQYLEKIYSTIPAEDINNTRVKLQTLFDKLFNEARVLLETAESDRDKREAMDLLLRMMDKFTDFLERFGIKAKAVENIAIQGQIDNRIVVEIVDAPIVIDTK